MRGINVTRLQRASEGSGQSTRRGGDDVVQSGGVRFQDLRRDLVMLGDGAMHAEGNRLSLGRKPGSTDRAFYPFQPDVRSIDDFGHGNAKGWYHKRACYPRHKMDANMTSRKIVPAAVMAALAIGQTPAERPFRIVALDPALNAIIAPGTKLETLGEHFGLTEGPVWIQGGKSGYLLFSDCAANVIYKWAPGGVLSVFLENSGYTGKDNLNVGQQTITGGRVAIVLIGSNGLALDPQGRLVITAMVDRNVVRLEKDGTRTMLADRYDGKRFSGPNDVTVKSDGAVYFTDSVNGMRGGGASPARELPFNGFYLVKDGKVTLLGGDKDLPGDFPNGIALSPDEKHLYVTAGFRKTLRYDLLPDDTVANPKVFLDAGNDGMKVDRDGNLYSTVQGNEIWITSPEGKHLGTIQLPQIAKEPRPRIVATNMAFGDSDGKTLYITACTHLFRLRVKIPGSPVPAKFP